MNYHVQVNTAGDPPGAWAGNLVDYKTAEEAEAAARDLFRRWTAVNHWRVIDDDGLVVAEG